MKTLGKALKLAVAAAITLAGVGVATPAFANPAWQKQVVQLIAQNQNYPRSAAMRKEEGTTRVRVSLDASGNVTNVEIVGPSGSETLDREAERLFQKIGNFPAPPSGAMNLVVPVVWKLN
jgi:periplasmic protein TonB